MIVFMFFIDWEKDYDIINFFMLDVFRYIGFRNIY